MLSPLCPASWKSFEQQIFLQWDSRGRCRGTSCSLERLCGCAYSPAPGGDAVASSLPDLPWSDVLTIQTGPPRPRCLGSCPPPLRPACPLTSCGGGVRRPALWPPVGRGCPCAEAASPLSPLPSRLLDLQTDPLLPGPFVRRRDGKSTNLILPLLCVTFTDLSDAGNQVEESRTKCTSFVLKFP